jgi:hypothetical protein
MRQLVVLGAALLLVPAASAAAKPKTGFAFGRVGGNIRPFTLTIQVDGTVKADGAAPAHRMALTKVQLATLNRIAFLVDFEHMPAVTACPQTLPDIAAQFIRVGARTVRVHGACLKGFDRLWAALSRNTSG